MIKFKNIIIIIIIYLVVFISIKNNFNILYPYYFVKDLILYPVRALSNNKEIILSNDYKDGIILSLKDEIEDLKKLNQISNLLSDYKIINATIIERNREYWFNTITIDKGEKNNVKEDFIVTCGEGLIGRVSNVREYSSDVKLITTNDVKNKMSVLIKNGNQNIYGITNGYDSKNDLLKIIITDDIDIKKDSFVYTSGLGGIYPKGVLIGKVENVSKANDEVTIIVLVKLSANINDFKYVNILQKNNY